MVSDRVATFDRELRAWILCSYADVSAALRDPRLLPPGAGTGDTHVAVREAATRAFSPERLAEWRAEMERSASDLARLLPDGRPVDLVRDFAEPWSLEVAVMATRARAAGAQRLAALAREIFLAAASPDDSGLQPRALAAAAELAGSLPDADAVTVQAFVALSQTLPGFLANAWCELFRHPDQVALLRAERDLMPQAIEELLRYAGPARALFRDAAESVVIEPAAIEHGDRVILLLSEANRDAAQFPEPDRLDFERGAAGHLAFGGGAHSCSGAALIRMAAAIATGALLERAGSVEVIGEGDWTGGFAIRARASVTVALRTSDGSFPE